MSASTHTRKKYHYEPRLRRKPASEDDISIFYYEMVKRGNTFTRSSFRQFFQDLKQNYDNADVRLVFVLSYLYVMITTKGKLVVLIIQLYINLVK